MPAYIIFFIEKVTDEAKMASYRQHVRATMAGHNLVTRVRYGRKSVVEGKPIEGVAVVEFPSFEEAERWYHSPDYQAIVKHRLEGAMCHTVIVEGLAEGA